jgi:hypothetical protein
MESPDMVEFCLITVLKKGEACEDVRVFGKSCGEGGL